ncbi:Glutaredoxin-2, mitochondrial [Phytophthora boehmeriae]|uniref:Glutaredoxin-2, mitochondrial n=1 Tax=Phytophthora boehmeriae TaxID=109152 RepID=A0A8T1X3X3_9STRA|nr:Glutaredoxin-2, mitochondrial [Phytophthora boehmeriae]
MGAAGSRENETAALEFVDRVTSENGVTVFSKSYCPYCNLAKSVLDEAGVKYHVVELDQKSDVPTRSDIQNALATATGRRTVPNVFIKKESIGGGTDVQALFQSGKLTEMLHAAGVIA